MKNIAFCALFSGFFILIISNCGKQCSTSPPKHIFEMEDVGIVELDFLTICENGKAVIIHPLPGAEVGEFYMVVPASSEDPQEATCMDIVCEVEMKDAVTITAFSCFDGVSDPPPTQYTLKRTKR